MKIASLVVKARADHFPELKASLAAIPGVQVHDEAPASGRLIVTVEDGEGYSMTDSIVAVNLARNVLSVTLAYEYTDEGLETQEV